jgi:hypothetical protein
MKMGPVNSGLLPRAAALGVAFWASAARAQTRDLQILGVDYPPGTQQSATGDSSEVPVRISSDGRHARFPLQISIRNNSNDPARFKVQMVVTGARRLPVTPVYSVASGEVRRISYDLDADFAATSAPSPGGVSSLPASTPPIVLPGNPVLAEIRLLSDASVELDRSTFHILLRETPRSIVRRVDRDLILEDAMISIARPPGGGQGIVTASAVISNNGSSTWGFPGDVSFELQRGTPETRLQIMGASGMPTTRSLPLPRGLPVGGIDTVTTRLLTRLRSTGGPIRPGEIIRVNPPLRARAWYTLTVSASSESDTDPSNDSVRLVFMLNDDMSIGESRIVRVPNRVRGMRTR